MTANSSTLRTLSRQFGPHTWVFGRVDSRESPTNATAKAPSCSIHQTRGITKSIAYETHKSSSFESCGLSDQCTLTLYITYKLANTPTELAFFSESRKRSGFHSSLSSPQIWGKLSGLRQSFIYHDVIRAHRLYTSMWMSMGVPFLIGIDDISSPDLVVMGKSKGIASSPPATLRSIQAMGCSLIDS